MKSLDDLKPQNPGRVSSFRACSKSPRWARPTSDLGRARARNRSRRSASAVLNGSLRTRPSARRQLTSAVSVTLHLPIAREVRGRSTRRCARTRISGGRCDRIGNQAYPTVRLHADRRSSPRRQACCHSCSSATPACQPYDPIWRAMQAFTDARGAGNAGRALGRRARAGALRSARPASGSMMLDAGRHPGRAGRSRRPGDVSRIRGQIVAAIRCSICAGSASACAELRAPDRAGGDRYAGRMEHRRARARTARRASIVGGAKVAALGLPDAARLHRSMVWRSTSTWTWSCSTASIPAVFRALQVTSVLDLGGPSSAGRRSKPVLIDNSRAVLRSTGARPTPRSGPEPCASDRTPAWISMVASPRPLTDDASPTVAGDPATASAASAGVARSAGRQAARRATRSRALAGAVRRLRRCCASRSWIRVRIPPGNAVAQLKAKLRENRLVTVCEEASCPNIHEVLQPRHRDVHDPRRGLHAALLASATSPTAGRSRRMPTNRLNLARTDRRHGPALRRGHLASTATTCAMAAPQHFADCIREARALTARRIEDRDPHPRLPRQGPHGARAGDARAATRRTCSTTTSRPCADLYPNVRPGRRLRLVADPAAAQFKAQHPDVPTKSGIMLGLGETMEQVQGALRDLRAHDVDMITIGQYLQPTPHHHPVMRYWTPEEFKALEDLRHGAGLQPRRLRPAGALPSYHAGPDGACAGYVNVA